MKTVVHKGTQCVIHKKHSINVSYWYYELIFWISWEYLTVCFIYMLNKNIVIGMLNCPDIWKHLLVKICLERSCAEF